MIFAEEIAQKIVQTAAVYRGVMPDNHKESMIFRQKQEDETDGICRHQVTPVPLESRCQSLLDPLFHIVGPFFRIAQVGHFQRARIIRDTPLIGLKKSAGLSYKVRLKHRPETQLILKGSVQGRDVARPFKRKGRPRGLGEAVTLPGEKNLGGGVQRDKAMTGVKIFQT